MGAKRILDGAASGWAVFWLAFTAVYIHLGSLAFAALAILLGAVGWAVWIVQRQSRPILDPDWLRPAAGFVLFFAWLALSGNWSGQGPTVALRVALLMAFAVALPVLLTSRPEYIRTRLSNILMVTALLGTALLLADVATGYGLNLWLGPLEPGGDMEKRLADAEMNIGRGHVAYAVLAPVLVALFATRLTKRVAWMASIGFLSLLVLGSLMNGLAIVPIIVIAALPFAWVSWRRPGRGLRLSLSALAGSILLAPLIGVASRLAGEGALSRLPMSWDHRVRMWDYCLTRIQEDPLIGKGLDSSRTMQDEFTTRIGVDWPIVSLHPHNVGLQTWMEAGAVGAVLLSVAIFLLRAPLSRLVGADPWRGSAVSGILVAVAAAGAVTVGAWQYWWWGLVALALSLVVLIPRQSGAP